MDERTRLDLVGRYIFVLSKFLAHLVNRSTGLSKPVERYAWRNWAALQ